MNRHFLIADDCVDLLQQVVFSCQVLGWEATAVTTADEALHTLTTTAMSGRTFNAVIVDIAIPGCGGTAFLHRIRAACNDVSIVVVTGSVNELMERQVSQIDRCVILEKPILFGQLLAAVDRAANNNGKTSREKEPAA